MAMSYSPECSLLKETDTHPQKPIQPEYDEQQGVSVIDCYRITRTVKKIAFQNGRRSNHHRPIDLIGVTVLVMVISLWLQLTVGVS